MNKQFLKTSLVALMAGMYSAGASAAPVASPADGTASANIVAPIQLNETAQMDFGDLAPGATLSTDFVVDLADTRSISGGGDGQMVGGTAAVTASFTITGNAGSLVNITIADGGNDLQVGGVGPALAFSPTLIASKASGYTIGGGDDIILVGGTLTVPSGTTAGLYTSATAYTVTVDYQ